MVPFCEKRRVCLIHLLCGCCPTFIGGTRDVSPKYSHIMFFPFHWTQTNPPEVTALIEKNTFPVVSAASQSQKPMCQHDLPGVFRISLWRWILWKKRKKTTKFRYPPYVTLHQFIPYTYFAMSCEHGLAPDTKMLAQSTNTKSILPEHIVASNILLKI